MTTSQGVATGSMLILAAIVTVVGLWVVDHVPIEEIGLPVVAILGVLAVLSALAIIAVAFSSFQLADQTQAMGLPEGSVRAVIALSLVVLFAVLSFHLYASLSASAVMKTLPVGEDKAASDQIAATIKGTVVIDSKKDATAKPTYTIYYQQNRDTAGDDFAKQLLTMLGVLLTSITSFYFGAKTATSAVAQGANAAQSGNAPASNVTLRGINPTTFARGPSAVKFMITGDGLDMIKSVKVATGASQVEAAGVTSSSNSVQCSLLIDATMPSGAWDIVVTNADGGVTKLPGALTVT